jgi:uncharacterized protein
VSSLTDRLRGIIGGGAVPRLAPELVSDGRLQVPSAPLRPAPAALGAAAMAQAAATLGGWVATSASGAVIVVDRQYASADVHGRVRVGDVLDTLLDAHEARALLSPHLCDRLWFLDLETTGLAGGAGTQAFLVGCATISRDGMSLRQFLLPGYEHEPTLLADVAAWAADRGAIVTFNGKSFDVPLIETRYLFHRVPFPLDGMPHVDMLHPARRLWRARGTVDGAMEASCSLGTLERLLAGVHRIGDVPGFEIPARYFQFVRDGNARPLEAVLEHNRLDLISLALVMARAITLLERGPGATRDAYECLGLARVYDAAGRADDAEAAYLRSVDLLERVGRDPETCGEALRRLAYCRRRSGRMREAAAAWQQLADLPRCPALLRREAREALAIFHEHRARDLETAHAHARHLLSDQPAGKRRDDAVHRLRRIERKLARNASSSSLWLEPDMMNAKSEA